MKTQEYVEKAIAKYQKMFDDNKYIMDFEDDFLKSNTYMDNKQAYIISAVKYYEASLICSACEKLIKNCRWILDIE